MNMNGFEAWKHALAEASFSPIAKKYGRVPAIVNGQLEVPENFIEKGEADAIGSIKSIMESY
ncbi:hypothetical protein UP17_10005 [Peribacillus simplex]|nr:hypothetical protein [Peribacillus simplex]AMM92819.1 hypothetical protein UP17_10005 [Peribacillus simplex]